MTSKFQRILVTGSTGFLGHHLVPRLREQCAGSELACVGSSDFNLLKPDEVERMFKETKPDAVIHLAAKSGGIMDNRKRPADYVYENLWMNTAVFQSALHHGVKKMVAFMGGCSYPAKAVSPIGEDQMWNGFPQIDSAGYSTAKKMLLVQSWAYRQQHGFNSVVLVPGNMYGEWDNFNVEQAHVIPALIRRMVEAREQDLPEVTAYGTGKPTRDFVYAGDVAATIPWFLANYDSSEPVNISTGTRISIRELTETVKRIAGYKGRISWDTSKTDGQMDKIFAVDRLHQLGLRCDTPLEAGIRRTVEWFLKARKEGSVRL
jgi:GDP-L-fucose synthase